MDTTCQNRLVEKIPVTLRNMTCYYLAGTVNIKLLKPTEKRKLINVKETNIFHFGSV